MHYSEAIERFIRDLEQAAGTYDWIDGPEEYKIGLGHVDPETLNQSAFEVQIGVPIEYLSEDEVDELDEAMNRLADEYEVSVRLSEGNPESCTYTFDLHAMFLGGTRGEHGHNN